MSESKSSKTQAAEHLKKLGYDAKLDGGIVMVYVQDKESLQETYDKVQEILQEIGYCFSYGVSPKKKELPNNL